MKWLVLAALCACQGNRDDGPGGGSAIALGPEAAPVFDHQEAGMPEAGPPPPSDAAAEEPDPQPDPGKLIAELGAIPAWQAVIDRAQLLARRGQHGVVYGRIGPVIMQPGPAADDAGVAGPPIPSGYTWLVDDTEGNGALGIRVALQGKTANAGERVVLGGAWQLDEQRRWYWKVDSLQTLPPAPASDLKEAPPAVPDHSIPMGGLPYGGRMITTAKDGDIVYFQLVGPPPANEGDGWPVANELGDKVFALLVLPGERSSYGAQDMRAPDERWQLKRAQTYWVRIGKIQQRGPDRPVLIRARTAPVRIN